MVDEKCPQCGFDVKIKVNSCPRCGGELHPELRQASAASAQRLRERESRQRARREREEKESKGAAVSFDRRQLATAGLLLLLIGITGVFCVGYLKAKGFFRPKPTFEGGLHLSVEDYHELQNGMTYNEVCQLFGGPGEQLKDDEAAAAGIKHYFWTTDKGDTISASFQNNRLIAKSQTGLTHSHH